MAAAQKPDVVSNALGCVFMLALILSFGGCAVRSAGRVIDDTLNPRAAHERRVAERNEQMARDAKLERDRVVQEEKEAARKAADAAERKRHEDERDAKEKECARQLGFDACREIYRPTDAEIRDQLRVVDRANQLSASMPRATPDKEFGIIAKVSPQLGRWSRKP